MREHLKQLSAIEQAIKKEFDSNRRILSFDEYIVLAGEKPEVQLRGTARYAADMMDHFGKTPLPAQENNPSLLSGLSRFKLFDEPVDGVSHKVVGQEYVQNQIYKSLRTFARQGLNNKLLLLHGPNGSAKSSIVHALMGGLERYSQTPDGALYSFNWVFPLDKITKGSMGINQSRQGEALQSFARLGDEEVSARLPCDMRDHPFLLIPRASRLEFLKQLLGDTRAETLWKSMPSYLTQGDLCHRCRQVVDALSIANQGDYRRVLMHVQVERFYYARRYRRGIVTIEPQMHVDAHSQQLTMSRSVSALPPALQSLNLFSVSGDLIDGNRGMIEYSDLLKRPLDSFKYLLSACESGAVNVGNAIAYLDTLLIGSTNELQLDAFKEFPDFTSFKARFELVRVPYLLKLREEQEIYAPILSQVSAEKHVSPHVAWTAALWSVLTRLKKPNSINYAPQVSSLVSNLSPLEKARLYDSGEIPSQLGAEDKKLLRANLRKIRDEYSGIPYYEGRIGASAREIKSILHDAAQNSEFTCLSPLAVLREMEEFVKRVTEYDFLKQDVKDGYHDCAEFVHSVRTEYLNRIDREVRDSIGLYDSAQWEDFLRKYVQQISLVLKKEKVKNPMTGRLEDPDFALIAEFERIIEAVGDDKADPAAREAFRQSVISQVGAWSLDHPGLPVVYAEVFPEFWKKLEKHYYESQKSLLKKMSDALLVYQHAGTQAPLATNNEGDLLARQTVQNMTTRLGYCEHCAKEVISFLMKQRY